MFAIYVSGEFPLEDYEELAGLLTASDVLVPAFIPAEVGLLSMEAVTYASHMDGLQTLFVPDRNIVSRLVRVVQDGRVEKRDMPTQVALSTMAVAQTVNFNIEPSISFHEYAYSQGNIAANEELSLFRVADHADPRQWIDLALGRRDSFLPIMAPPVAAPVDLAFPLERWKRNYVAVLKIGELLLGELSPLDKMAALLDWMGRDFLIAAPAAVFATYLFAPIPKYGRALKGIESADRERAIAGIKNAAWDVTHVSELVRMAREREADGNRYIFVTADRVLRLVADMVMELSIRMSDGEGLEEPLSAWWSKKQAKAIGTLLAEKIALASAVRPHFRVSLTRERLDEMTVEGERWIRSYAP